MALHPPDPRSGTVLPELSETLLHGTPYRPVRQLGRGGMGEVIEAEHIGLGKPVVVKLLHRDLNREPRLVERMRIEAQALARLAHPNLVVVTDFGQTPEGRTYLAMERLYGRTLREELLARGALPPREAIDLMIQALAGLSAAHSAGIVHRDVKLENLFVCDPDAQGRRLVKVLDFGIAKVVAPAGDRRAPLPSPYPTEEGVLLGTPRYFSPEQAMGLAVDARTDVYAAGVVLYALLAGRGPFEHVGPLLDLLRAHASEVPEPPSVHAPGPIPADLDGAVMKALEKQPERRFEDAARFAAALARIAAALGVPTHAGGGPGERGRPTHAGGGPGERGRPTHAGGGPGERGRPTHADHAPRWPEVPTPPPRWQATEPLSVPPVHAPLAPTLRATVGVLGSTFGAPDRLLAPSGPIPGPGSRAERRSGARTPALHRHNRVVVAILVVGAMLFGFAIAALSHGLG